MLEAFRNKFAMLSVTLLIYQKMTPEESICYNFLSGIIETAGSAETIMVRMLNAIICSNSHQSQC